MMTDPFARDIDLTTKAGFTTFSSAVTPEAAWKPLEVVVKNAKPLWEPLDHKQSMYAWKVCYVPTSEGHPL